MIPVKNSQAQLSQVISKKKFFSEFLWDNSITFKLHLSYSSFFETDGQRLIADWKPRRIHLRL